MSVSGRFRMTIGRKIYALIGLGFVGLLGTTFLDSHELASGLKQQKQIELKHLAEMALGIVKEEHAAGEKAGMPVAEAQKRAKARVAALRYGNNDYFFITNMQTQMVMHPMSPELDGKDLTGNKDPNGKSLFVEMTDVVRRNGSGFVDYQWAKPGSDKPLPKLTYVAGFAPWGWIVGTGVYIDDLEAQTWAATQRSLIGAGLVLVVLLVVSVIMARRITGPLNSMTSAMKELAAGQLDVTVPGIGRSDEVGEMAGAVEVFKTNAVERQRLEAEQRRAEARAAEQRKQDMVNWPMISSAPSARSSKRCRPPRPNWKRRRRADLDRGDVAAARDRGRGGFGRSVHQRAVGGLGDRGDELVGQRDQPAGAGFRADRP